MVERRGLRKSEFKKVAYMTLVEYLIRRGGIEKSKRRQRRK